MRKAARVAAVCLLLYAAFIIIIRDTLSVLSMQPGYERAAISDWLLPDVVALAAVGYVLYGLARKLLRND